jgi:hypothetical protein
MGLSEEIILPSGLQIFWKHIQFFFSDSGTYLTTGIEVFCAILPEEAIEQKFS